MKKSTLSSSPGKVILVFVLLTFYGLKSYSQCGYDIYIANDQSGSVDATENMQSRQFIEKLALAFPLGNANTESRIAISSWSWNTDFQQYNFPSAGTGYTTLLSDIIAYRNSSKPFSGNTDPYAALLRAWQNINLTPVPGRTVPKLIILMTDAYSSQVSSNIIALADQIKAAGYKILVMGVDAASGNPPQPIFQAVASPGLNLTASSYDVLIANAVTTVQQAIAQICPATIPPFDLSVSISSFNCNTGVVNYTVTNGGAQSFGPATLSVSFYNTDPRQGASQLLGTHSQAGVSLSPNTSATYSFTNASLNSIQTIYAVVNLNTSGNNATPPLPFNLTGRLLIAGEGNLINNFSNGFTGSGCARAVLQVSNTGVMGCNNTANYQVQVCNTGSAAANIQGLTSLPAPGFVLESAQTYDPNNSMSVQLTRSWGTYFGGAMGDYISDMATDAFGNMYVIGSTLSPTGIATAGTFSNTYNFGNYDGFVAKFNAAGVLQWGTYLGGAGFDHCDHIAVDGAGNVYVAGQTSSTSGIASAGAFQTTLAGAEDGFLMKFDGTSGTRLWGTYFGATTSLTGDGRSAVSVTGNDVYFATTATQAGSLATNGTTHAAGNDIVLTKFNSSGGRIWTTIFGGPGNDQLLVTGEVVANTSAVYVGGVTASASGIASGNYWDNTLGGSQDAFVARFDPATGNVVWGTYAGAGATDELVALTMESSGNLLAGIVRGGVSIIYRIAATGGVPLNSLVLPAGQDLSEIATSGSGDIYVCGQTNIAGFGTAGAYQSTIAGSYDLFFARYNSTFTQQQYFSYYGDTGNEFFFGRLCLVLDAWGNIVVGGITQSPGTILATPGAHQTSAAGNTESMVAKFAQQTAGVLQAGQCVQLNYVYNASAAADATHDYSFELSAVKVMPTDDDPFILPNTNFTVPGYAGTHNGFNGAVNATDDVVKSGAPCTTPASPVTVAVSLGSGSGCSQSFSKATITITNPNTGVTFHNVRLLLNLTGTGSSFSGEPYNLTAGLLLSSPDITNPNYPWPGVPKQLNGLNGQQYLTAYSLPPGTSSFDVDIALGTGATNLSVTGQNLPVSYNVGGNTNTANGTGIAAPANPPVINLNCPGGINVGATISLSATTTGANTVQWSSATDGNLSNSGTVAAPQTTYIPTAMDLVNGYADVSLTAITSGGCDDVRACRVLINNVQRDFGDAPISFDLGTTAQPVAAASTKLPGLYLGSIDPDVEAIAQPSVACDGDGNDEEGLRYYPANARGQSSLVIDVEITNNSNTQAYLIAYIDWNEDGDFLDTNERSTTVTIPSLAGTTIYRPSFNTPFATGLITTYIRLRLSSDAAAISTPYGASPEGEVEDHVVDITVLPVEVINFKATPFGSEALLSWQMAVENNNDHFEIERSADGSNWQKIGTVAGYENSAGLLTYDFTDHQPYSKSNYYRLRQINKDGTFSYSIVRQVNFQSKNITVVYPNPVKDQLHIATNYSGINYDVTITNTAGQELLRKNKASDKTILSIGHLPAGVYIVKLSQQQQQPVYYKVIKQ